MLIKKIYKNAGRSFMDDSSTKSNNILLIAVTIIVLVICVFCLLAGVPVKNSVNKEIEGISWSIDNFDKERTIKAEVSGTYYDYIIELWNNDYFKGDITITGEWNYNIPQVTAYFVDQNTPDGKEYTYAFMISYMPESNSMESRGEIFINKKKQLSEFVICPDGSKDMRYAFPASNKEDAEKLDKELNILMWGK